MKSRDITKDNQRDIIIIVYTPIGVDTDLVVGVATDLVVGVATDLFVGVATDLVLFDGDTSAVMHLHRLLHELHEVVRVRQVLYQGGERVYHRDAVCL